MRRPRRAGGLRARAAGALIALAATALAACSPATAGPRTIEIDVRHSAFSVSRLEVDPDETVRFVIHNTDPIDHEFILGDQAVQDRHETGTERRHGAIPGEVTILAGSTAETTYTFAEPGTVLFGCHLPGHYAYGMRGTVTVA